jgi:sulfoxide reductase heme-binding subunit YedZ
MVISFVTTSLQHFANSEAQIAASRVASSWQWYVIRAAGFVAAGLLIILMLSGIGQVTGLTYRYLEPIKAWAVHKALALALCGAIAVHVLFLLFDHYLPFSLPQIAIPFASRYGTHTSLLGVGLDTFAIALGVLAMYGVTIIVASSLGWIDSKQKTWRWLHYLSYFVILAIFIHALGAGADLKYGIFRMAWIALFFVLLLAVLSRIWRAGTIRKKVD